MEKVETKYGILISVIGVWFLSNGILTLISNWNSISWGMPWQELLYLLCFIISIIVGILGFTAGLLIYKGNLKGGMLALISGLVGITLGLIGGILEFYIFYHYGMLYLIEIFNIMGQIILSCSLPTLFLIAGIKKFSLKLGILITITGAFIVTSYAMWILSSLSCIVTPSCDTSLEWTIIEVIYIAIGGIGIVAGLSIKQRLSRGYKLSILAGIIGLILATVDTILTFYFYVGLGGYHFGPALLSRIIDAAIIAYQSPTIFLLGGILAREQSKNTWINSGFSIDDKMIFA